MLFTRKSVNELYYLTTLPEKKKTLYRTIIHIFNLIQQKIQCLTVENEREKSSSTMNIRKQTLENTTHTQISFTVSVLA